ncbi:MAG: hypothetical protein JWN82_620 [Candidatus Saccharibacteria bacterium]|nr:hypothetical protein [Candidatus Saccharibacteria bacterium]
MEESSGHKKQIIVTLAVLIVIVAIVAAAMVAGNKDDTQNSGSSNTSAMTATVDPSATYTDGTYEATGDYVSPGGNEEITISVTLKDNVVTDTSAINGATDTEAKQHQDDFIGGYKSLVVGKNINEVKLSRVSGSSLTSQGFNDAIQQIRNKAEV